MNNKNKDFMKNRIDEYKDPEIAVRMGNTLKSYQGAPVTIMEVCGTHTTAIFKYGIRSLLPGNIRLISGPGCPVCVTPVYYINSAIEISNRDNTIILTFGDMMRVPGSKSTLLEQKALGKDIRVVYSPLDSLKIAVENPDKNIVFLSIGFETTTPVIALTVSKAYSAGIKNFTILAANKTVPEALKVLVMEKDAGLDGFLYPGHVSAIIGTEFYREIAEKYGVPGVVAGFEPLDIMHAIISLVKNINNHKILVENEYVRVVREDGNRIALQKTYEVFEPCDAVWRGLGNIPGSGMKLKDKYSAYDAWKIFGIKPEISAEPSGCLCGEVLKGKKTPVDCKLFRNACKPECPIGACMVSSEGTCAAYYKYL